MSGDCATRRSSNYDLKTTADTPLHRPLALTAGEPAGIGPDLVIQLAQREHDRPLVVIADPALLRHRARQLHLPLDIVEVATASDPPAPSATGMLHVLPVKAPVETVAGVLDSRNSRYVLETLSVAVNGCLDGCFAAMITAPVHKGIINDAGIRFSGHTEFIAGLTGGHPVMMLACPGLRVALVTTHLPLRDVADAITPDLLIRTARTLHTDLRSRFGIGRPRILVCGLNPHAGESGHLGREEIQIIEPALALLRKEGIDVAGPFPADTLFTPALLQTGDAVLAMYHDQGLPVLKHKGFGAAVNVTLGLPIIRTSVDHGTALDLAGSGTAHAGSLEAAIAMAAEMADAGQGSLLRQ